MTPRSEHQQPKEYIITDDELKDITKYLNMAWNDVTEARVVWDICHIRSRTHTPAASATEPICDDSCKRKHCSRKFCCCEYDGDFGE